MSAARSRALIFALGAAAAIAPHSIAAQQAAEPCAGMPSLADEVACLRRALAEREKAPQDSPSPPPVASNAAPRTMGAEQVSSERAPRPSTEAETVRAIVVAASDDPRGLLTVQLDNGQAWQQTERSGVPLRANWVESKPVEISRSGFGGYRLRFPGKGRQFAVRRLR